MDVSPESASALSFPKPDYMVVERERRWLCGGVPRHLIARTEDISDVYVTGTRLRLREAQPIGGGPAMRRLSRKADIDPQTRLITSIYLPEAEFALLAAALTGIRIRKLRHRLHDCGGADVCVDEFQDQLHGLILAEAQFESDAAMAVFPMPEFALREVTDDLRFTGGFLAAHGLPDGI